MKTLLPAPAAVFLAAAALCAPAAPAQAVTLYDPALATLPGPQGWLSLAVGNPPAQSFVGGHLRTDTSTDPLVTQFINYRNPPAAVPLDTLAGFTLSFGLQVVAEAHQSVNRAGYSVLVQGLDETKALELGFWGNEVWALTYTAGGADSGYLHGNGALLNTTTAFRQYALTVQNNSYTLRADGTVILTGAMIDYPVQGLSTFVYGTSNTLYMGDDSSRGQAITDLGLVSISAVPEPGMAVMLAAGLLLLARRQRPA